MTEAGSVTVTSLHDARRIDSRVMRVTVLEGGKPAMTLLRRTVNEKVQGLTLRSHIGEGIMLPLSSVAVDSIVTGEITIGENVVLKNCEIKGAGKIVDGSVLTDYVAYGADRKTEIPLQPHRVIG